MRWGKGQQSTHMSRSLRRWPRTTKGHEEQFLPTRLHAGCGFGKETIAEMRRNGRDAPKAVTREALRP